MQTANSALMELICGELDRRLSLRRRLEGCAGKVALKIRASLLRDAVAPSLENVGRALGQSPRTLRRWLGDEGITYRAILDQVRLELEQLLELQGLTRGEIGARLGYGDTAAYLHGRKRWHMDDDVATTDDGVVEQDEVSARRASRARRPARHR
jgi:AraC-like DNA-binding protein